jgi:hypothetical protein
MTVARFGVASVALIGVAMLISTGAARKVILY